MKCAYILLFVAIGLKSFKAEDEVTEPTVDATEPSIISEKVKFLNAGCRK